MASPNQSNSDPVDQVKVLGSHKQAVAAGTVVNLWVDPQVAGPDDFEWRVTGPFTNQLHSVIDGGRNFDLVTEGFRPGAYTVTAVRTPTPQAPVQASAQTPSAGLGGPTPPASAPTPQGIIRASAGGGGGQALVRSVTLGTLDRTLSWALLVTPGLSAVSGDGVVPVSLQRTALLPTEDQILWVIIRNRTQAIGFNRYREFIDSVMCDPLAKELSFQGPDAYHVLKLATDAFLMHETGVLNPALYKSFPGLQSAATTDQSSLDQRVALDSLTNDLNDPVRSARLQMDEQRRLGRSITSSDVVTLRDAYYEDLTEDLLSGPVVLPYLKLIRQRLADIPLKPSDTVPNDVYGILRSRLLGPPAIELIHSYWLEEGQLAQTMNAILARYQGRALRDGPNPLSRMYIDPLRPLGNLLWGWIQDDFHRLTIRRRHYEYDHQYGMKLIGRAIPNMASVDRRSQFLESFHNLLYKTHVFYTEDDDTTMIADGFPLLNALRETHLLLAEGADNQFGDLPTAARAEFMIMQWLLARPEMRDFLGGRPMVPYEETWMDRVDTMKSIQGWTDVTITHFRDMAVFGEQILLSIRYGNWAVENDQQTACNWARYWRSEIQRYTHAYRSATGVDLSGGANSTMPSVLLNRRNAKQQRRRA